MRFHRLQATFPRIPQVKVIFDCPFQREYIFTMKSDLATGFTLGGFLSAVRQQYAQMYATEEQTTSLPVESHAERAAREGTESCFVNRAATNGVYGIGGHDLGDLGVCGFWYTPGRAVYLNMDT